ncbi:MAG TPA: hypothetical protein ENN05_07570 [Deltaproteobacteria bacterium]|nr:hypothetical protein [Deltaproteobacteria bacterium]
MTRGVISLQPQSIIPPPQLILVFGETSRIKNQRSIEKLFSLYPGAQILGCSTAGEISGAQVLDDTLVATAIHFESSSIKISCEDISCVADSMDVGRRLAGSLDKEGLVHAFVLSDGLTVNGSALVEGMLKELPANVTITGGLSGDKDRFQETLVFCNGRPEKNKVTILGLYGDKLKVGYGSFGGWDPFGPERLVTRSDGNILYELDGKSCLGLYKTYLGDHAKGLPATALLFPLSIRSAKRPSRLVRTILSVNEDDQSMIFAGDIPEGSYAQFMKANFNRLIDGAMEAAKMSCSSMNNVPAQLAVLISCVGRKMVLKQRIEEEVESVQEILGEQTVLSGFYSYGEISPSSIGGTCELHNQTMTITTFTED